MEHQLSQWQSILMTKITNKIGPIAVYQNYIQYSTRMARSLGNKMERLQMIRI